MKLRGYLQEMMIVWLIWEFAESPHDLRNLMRAWLAGSWVLAILTIVKFRDPLVSGQRSRFASPPWGRIRTMSPDFSTSAFRSPRFCSTARRDGPASCWPRDFFPLVSHPSC